jgi:hypothetical protein
MCEDKEPVADFYRFDNLKDSGGLNYKGKEKLEVLFHEL